MTTKTLSKSDLTQFTGSENWYRHGINRNVLYTEGVQYVAEHGGAQAAYDEREANGSNDPRHALRVSGVDCEICRTLREFTSRQGLRNCVCARSPFRMDGKC